MANGHGGARPGSGPKKGSILKKTIDKQLQREVLRQMVMKALEPMTTAQIEAAKGVNQFIYRDDHGKFKVIDDPDELRACLSMGKALRLFTRLPSTSAYAYLLDQALDKAPQSVAISGPDGGPIEISNRLHAARERSRKV